MSPIPSNRYDEASFAIGIIKNVTGEKTPGGRGWYPPPGRPRVKYTIVVGGAAEPTHAGIRGECL